VNPESHRYKVFVGDKLRDHDIFNQLVATKEFFDSNFQAVENGLIRQVIPLDSSVLRNPRQDLWITVISFIRDKTPIVDNYKFLGDFRGSPDNEPTVIAPISVSSNTTATHYH